MRELVELLKKSGAIKFGDFVLSSGKRSNVYVDVKQAITKPGTLGKIADLMAEKLGDVDFDRIACIELGGVPIAVALSLRTGRELVIFRKKRKDYGTADDRIGEVRPGDRVVVVEDVVTTGKSAKSVVDRVEGLGGEVVAILAVVDREESDLNVRALLKLSEILEDAR